MPTQDFNILGDKSMEARPYFQQPTAAEISRYGSVRDISDKLVESIRGLSEDEAVIIKCRLVPERYASPQKFMKHGPDVKIQRFKSLEGAVAANLTPTDLRSSAFNDIRATPYCGYTFKPFMRTDKRTRRVPLVECLEGAHIYCYASQNRPGRGERSTPLFPSSITIRPYDDAHKVKVDGAEVVAEVPSRTKRKPRYNFKFRSVPITENRFKWGIAFGLATDHNCMGRMYDDMRYTYLDDKESSEVFTFCAHEIAGYLALIDFYVQRDKNRIPLQMNPFAIPAQETVDYYVRLCKNCLIKTPEDKKPRKLNRAEKEILLWGMVHKSGYDRTFFAGKRSEKPKKLRDYNWTLSG
ncbi:MAG: hypothetical protein AB1668_01500 [Nanoarchaeota archaeon]